MPQHTTSTYEEDDSPVQSRLSGCPYLPVETEHGEQTLSSPPVTDGYVLNNLDPCCRGCHPMELDLDVFTRLLECQSRPTEWPDICAGSAGSHHVKRHHQECKLLHPTCRQSCCTMSTWPASAAECSTLIRPAAPSSEFTTFLRSVCTTSAFPTLAASHNVSPY
jgi:hypothetical protein